MFIRSKYKFHLIQNRFSTWQLNRNVPLLALPYVEIQLVPQSPRRPLLARAVSIVCDAALGNRIFASIDYILTVFCSCWYDEPTPLPEHCLRLVG